MNPEITLPWPDKKLSPNARGHWATKSKAKAMARRTAFALALEAGWRTAWPEGRLHVWIDGYAPDKRKRDHDNFLSSLKAALDGIAQAMQVDDSRFVPHPFIKEEVRPKGEVRVRITGSAGSNDK